MSGKKKDKETIFDRKEYQSLEDFADSLELIAKRLRTEGNVTLREGSKETVIEPNNQVKVEYKYVIKEGSRHKFEIELKWNTEDKPEFSIE